MLALMKTRHTEQAAEILLKFPPVLTEADRVRQAIEETLASLGHTVRQCNDEGEELYTFEEVFPEANPGLVLRGFRGLEEMTQIDLADKLGIHQNRVSEMENGKRSISIKMAKQLGEIFGTSHKTFL